MKWKIYNSFFNRNEAKKLELEIRDFKIDLIHTNTSVINLGGLLQKNTGIPHIWYIREFGEEDFGLYPLEGKQKFFKTINTQSTKIITVSKALEKKYQPYIEQEKLKVIYNGVGKENILEQKTVVTGEKINFLIAGTIQPAKGQDIAIHAVGELIKRGILNFQLYIAGSGDISWLSDLFPEQTRYITFLGHVSDMCTLRKSMDVELVCSKSEAFGRVTAEAMLGGIPVIGADTGGTPELILDRENGLIYKQSDAVDLADKMEFLISNPEILKKMGRNAQEYAIKQFTIERCAKELDEVYRSIVGV